MDVLKQGTPAPSSSEIQDKPEKSAAIQNFTTRYAKNKLLNYSVWCILDPSISAMCTDPKLL